MQYYLPIESILPDLTGDSFHGNRFPCYCAQYGGGIRLHLVIIDYKLEM